MDQHQTPDAPARPPEDLTVEVSSPDEDGAFTVRKTTKVGELIDIVVHRFGLAQGDVYSLALLGKLNEPFAKDRSLESYHLHDGAHLVLTSKGGGV